MSAKYSALLEACNTIQLTGKLGILEEGSVDEATSIKLQLVLQENVNFIKNQITRTPLIENVQMMLAEKWTQAILEDISFDELFNAMRNEIATPTEYLEDEDELKDDLTSTKGKKKKKKKNVEIEYDPDSDSTLIHKKHKRGEDEDWGW